MTSDFLQDQMNTHNCFDFDYKPNEGDQIIFTSEFRNKKGKRVKQYQAEYKYISLIFKDGKWSIDHYDAFQDITEQFDEGFVKLSDA